MVSENSSGDEENTPKRPSKVAKKVRKQCYMHLASVKDEKAKDFTRTRWNTYKNAITQWLGLQDESVNGRDIAYKHVSTLI